LALKTTLEVLSGKVSSASSIGGEENQTAMTSQKKLKRHFKRKKNQYFHFST
jgi:hypothetical protein